MKRATIADVATLAGVNKATVSHTISGKRPVSVETRARVEQAIRELGYSPHPLAQRLAGGSSRTIALAYPLYGAELAGLEMKFITGAASVINRAEYTFVLLTHPEGRPDGLEHLVHAGLLDGVLLMQVRLHDPRIACLTSANLPFVLIGRPAEAMRVAYIDLDLDAAMRLCVDHLVALGHRDLGYLSMEESDLGFAVRAGAAYLAACERHGLPARTAPCPLSTEGGRRAARELLRNHPATTAIIGWNDLVAWGALQGAEDAGRTVPADLSLVCFDNSTVAPIIQFRPTAIDIRAGEMAERATHMLLEMLCGKHADPPQVLLEPVLVPGVTTGPAPRPR
jgi:DNA-binding LacI/PurR family transcriptional regulator